MTLKNCFLLWRSWLVLASVAAVGTLGGCSAAGALNALVPTDSYTLRSAVPYGPDPRQQLDVYLPVTRQQPGPVVVFFYGGSWTMGERDTYRFVGEALASKGITAVIADYRLSPQVRYPVFLQDSAQAVLWTFDHLAELGADPRQVFVMGHSAGAYNAAMLALDARWLGGVGLNPAQLAGWIGMAGPYDFLPIVNPDVQVAFEWPGTPADSQPLFHVSRKAPPTLLMAARADTTVNPVRNSEALARKLTAAGAPAGISIYEKVSHVTLVAALARPLRGLAPVLERIERFVQSPAAVAAE
ncbi:MAG TPA: alpha/beta hydrolase [Polaromonas sp.]|uniref:alpha/beta hydrolase n=1 Tax=Polaromonas sp. TaxID=1869339 RepID=UPI002D23CBDE|nr:alpha/beta hydrolase [Polaromonas sp.]HYW56995.1 alpha/beta hydrolase [Polaromonas sp.]